MVSHYLFQCFSSFPGSGIVDISGRLASAGLGGSGSAEVTDFFQAANEEEVFSWGRPSFNSVGSR